MSHYKNYLQCVLPLVIVIALTSGCAATLEGIKSDFEKVGQKTGIGNSVEAGDQVENSASQKQDRISEIQSKLKDLGYYGGEITGEFSAPTEAAIQDFQLDKGYRIDGRPTQELLEALEAI